MYLPQHFATDDARALDAMRAHDFALLVSQDERGAPFATHCPLVVGDDGRLLRGHIAHPNPHWRHWERDPRVLAVFPGPHAYISPTLYATREAVPTWNYVAVHASGIVRCLHEAADKRAVLDALIARHEPAHAAQWAAQSERFAQAMLGAIVAFEIEVERIEAKFKLSQNRSAEDRTNVHAALRAGSDDARALAAWMERLGVAAA